MLSLIIETLFITDIWIFLYSKVLFFLNFIIPAKIPQGFLLAGVVPEPFEIPLYLGLMGLFTVMMIGYHRYIKPYFVKRYEDQQQKRWVFFVKFIAIVVLLLIFINRLGMYPYSGFEVITASEGSKYPVNLIFLVFLLITSYIVIQTALLSRVINISQKKASIVFCFIIFLLIAIATFEPQLPISGHDYSYFFGPIYDVSSGKTIFSQVSSQYGFLLIIIFSLLKNIGIFQWQQFPLYVWLFDVCQYFLIFYIVFKISKSASLATICLLSILTLGYFSRPYLPYLYPQGSAIRFFPLMLSTYILFKIKKIDSALFILLTVLVSLLVVDVGIYLLLAYIFTLFILTMNKQLSIKRFLYSCSLTAIIFLILLLLINVCHILLNLPAIDYLQLFSKIRDYSQKGFGMIPIKNNNYFWTFILIYFLSLFFWLRHKKAASNNVFVLYLTAIMLIVSLYYLGRTTDGTLFLLSMYPILILYIMVGMIFQNIKSSKYKIAVLSLLFLFTIVIPGYLRRYGIAEIVGSNYDRFKLGKIFISHDILQVHKQYQPEINLINELPAKKIVILSNDDTYLFLLSGKKNLLSTNPQTEIITEEDVLHATSNVSCPKQIVADCTLFNKCADYEKFNSYWYRVQPYLLKAIEAKCPGTYVPSKCTDKLCIASMKKL